MKKIKLLIAFITLLAAGNLQAQRGVFGIGPSFSIGVEAGIPVADLSTFNNLGIGGSAKLGVPLFDGGDVTLSAGYISFSGKNAPIGKYAALNLIPIKAGLRFKLANSVYGEPQLGYTSYKRSGASDGSGAFTYAANLGFLLSRNFDLAARYENASKSSNGQNLNLSHIGLRLAYNFGSK